VLLLLTIYKVLLFLFNIVELNSNNPCRFDLILSFAFVVRIFVFLDLLAIMVRFQTLACALLSLSASAYAALQQSMPFTKTPPASAAATTTNVAATTAPCALAASAQAQYLSAVPNGKLRAGAGLAQGWRTSVLMFPLLIGHSLFLSLRPSNVNAFVSDPHVPRCTCSYLKFVKVVLSNCSHNGHFNLLY
jgi:hypothetical protein